jgi:cysteinyl-tRNA synthetase
MSLKSFFSKKKEQAPTPVIPLFFHNTLGGQKVEFTMGQPRPVRMYNCGPTVYDRQHIGNLSMYVFTDVLRKVIEYNGYTVKQTINITDFGHLTSDADEGEDKMLKGLKRDGLKPSMANMKALAEKYTNIFLEDLRTLNIEVDSVNFPRASEYVDAQIAMIRQLEEKSYAYRAEDGLYFDTSMYPNYGALGHINTEGQKEGARVKKKVTKRNPADFVLWKFSKGREKMGWESPWGYGFPGWHIECSAMSRATLGDQLDIHTGGVEHIPIHHNNEIAQSEAATGRRPFSRIWMHRAHIQLDGGKIAKSKGTVVYLSDIVERGFHPLALRYLFLGAHYRSHMNFTWESLAAAQTALDRLLALREEMRHIEPSEVPKEWQAKFLERVNDDLDTPGALALVWEMVKDKEISPPQLLAALFDFDRVFGLNLKEPDEVARARAKKEIVVELKDEAIPEEIRTLMKERESARAERNFEIADSLRLKIQDLGYSLEDSSDGVKVFKR